MTAMLLAVLSASLIGSVHCAGMCGPFCGLAVSGGRSPLFLHAAYHGGRLVTYTLLGAVAGAIGGLVDMASTLAGLQPVALALAGAAMIAFGVAEIGRLRGWRLGNTGRWPLPQAWTRALQRGQRFAAKQDALPRALAIGLLTTLLPCGWLYAFVVTAGGSGSPFGGAAVMAVFWVGTLPVLLSLGVGVRRLTGVLGERLPLLTAVALVAVGVLTLSGRLMLSPETIAQAVTSQAADTSSATPDPTALPACCLPEEATP